MKNSRQLFRTLWVAAGVLLLTQRVQAIEWIQRDQFSSGAAETLRDESWISAKEITLSGEALDDVFAFGTTLDLRGRFESDVWAGGEKIMAAGHFKDHVRLLATTAQIAGTLDGALLAMGKTVKIDPTAVIAKNVLCFGETIIIEGSMAGHVRIIAQKATLGGTITGDVSITAQEIVILPDTVIGGNLTYTAPHELFLSSSVTLGGKLDRIFEKLPPKPVMTPNLAGHFFFAFAALLTGLVFHAIFSGYSATAVHMLNTRRGFCLLTGLIALILIPGIAFILLFTLLGMPLSLLLFLFYGILLYLSQVTVGFWLGAFILRRKELTQRNRTGTLAVGLLILYTLTAFTAIAFTVNVLVLTAGLGALLLALFKKPVLIIQAPNDIT